MANPEAQAVTVTIERLTDGAAETVTLTVPGRRRVAVEVFQQWRWTGAMALVVVCERCAASVAMWTPQYEQPTQAVPLVLCREEAR